MRLKKRSLRLPRNIKYVSGESVEYLELWKMYSSMPLPTSVKSVMLIGSPYFEQRKVGIMAGHALARLDMELRLANAVKDAGYRLIYKVHPGRTVEAEGIFDDKASILAGNVKDNLDKTDAFLCPSITTTAFSYALCTNRPIVTLDLNFHLYDPFPEAMELFQKRCSIVKTWIDEGNRIIFSEKELLEALSKKPEEPNAGFLKTYMFPKRRLAIE